jgi:hypothetical protein
MKYRLLFVKWKKLDTDLTTDTYQTNDLTKTSHFARGERLLHQIQHHTLHQYHASFPRSIKDQGHFQTIGGYRTGYTSTASFSLRNEFRKQAVGAKKEFETHTRPC